jgi:hypothetical protein
MKQRLLSRVTHKCIVTDCNRSTKPFKAPPPSLMVYILASQKPMIKRQGSQAAIWPIEGEDPRYQCEIIYTKKCNNPLTDQWEQIPMSHPVRRTVSNSGLGKAWHRPKPVAGGFFLLPIRGMVCGLSLSPGWKFTCPFKQCTVHTSDMVPERRMRQSGFHLTPWQNCVHALQSIYYSDMCILEFAPLQYRFAAPSQVVFENEFVFFTTYFAKKYFTLWF